MHPFSKLAIDVPIGFLVTFIFCTRRSLDINKLTFSLNIDVLVCIYRCPSVTKPEKNLRGAEQKNRGFFIFS